MDYHLNSQGKTLGVFPLDDLQQRRQRGQLSGTELVWCPGMAQWKALDEVLKLFPAPSQTLPLAVPPIQPLAPRRSSKLPLLVGAVLVLGLLVTAVLGLFLARPLLRKMAQAVRSSSDRADQAGVQLAARPITTNARTQTTQEVNHRRLLFRQQQYLEGYRRYGHRDPSWDADAQKLIQAWLLDGWGKASGTDRVDTIKLGNRLASSTHCDDPVVLLATADTCIEKLECARRWQRAVAAFKGSRYPAYPQFYATVRLAQHSSQSPAHLSELDSAAKELLAQSLKEGSLSSENQDDLAEMLLNHWGKLFLMRNPDSVVSIATQAGSSFEWLALVLEGERQLDAAWKARGNGWADSVSAEGWRDFVTHLQLAKKSFSHAATLHPEWPLAAQRMIPVSMGLSEPEAMRRWFDKAVLAQVDYPTAWNSLAWGLRPRWFGSQEAIRTLGITAIKTGRFDTDVPRTFFNCVRDLEEDSDLPANTHLYSQTELWPWMQRMYEGYIQAPSRVSEQTGWRSTYAAVAYLAGHYDVARQQLEALDWTPLSPNLQAWDQDLSLLPQEVAARTSPASNAIERAEISFHAGAISRALNAYRSLEQIPELESRAQDFIAHRIATLELEQHFQQGQWVDLLATSTNRATWLSLLGQGQLQPNGAFDVQAGPQGHLFFCLMRVGANLEVKGEFEILSSSSQSADAGLVLGQPTQEPTKWFAFRIKHTPAEGPLATFGRGWSLPQVTHPIDFQNGLNTFDLQIQDETVAATINGVEAFHGARLLPGLHFPSEDYCLGLGAFNDLNNTIVRYRNIQVRKLSAPPNSPKPASTP